MAITWNSELSLTSEFFCERNSRDWLGVNALRNQQTGEYKDIDISITMDSEMSWVFLSRQDMIGLRDLLTQLIENTRPKEHMA